VTKKTHPKTKNYDAVDVGPRFLDFLVEGVCGGGGGGLYFGFWLC